PALARLDHDVRDHGRVEAAAAVARPDAEREYANSVDVTSVPQHLEDAERQQPAVLHALQYLVEVRQCERERDRLVVHEDQWTQLRRNDRLQLLREVPDLLLHEGHEAPVALPRAVVDLEDDVDLLV